MIKFKKPNINPEVFEVILKEKFGRLRSENMIKGYWYSFQTKNEIMLYSQLNDDVTMSDTVCYGGNPPYNLWP